VDNHVLPQILHRSGTPDAPRIRSDIPEMIAKPVLRPVLTGIAAAFVCAMLAVSAYQVWKQRALEGARNETLSRLATLRARIESELNAVIHVTDGLVTYIMLNPDMTEDEFRDIARTLLQRKPDLITHFTVAPGNIIRFLYPEEGNEAAFGLDLNLHPQQRDSVRYMMDTGSTVLAGPWELVQGGVRLIVRSPIFVQTPEGERSYWGLVSIPVDMEALYGSVDLDGFEEGLEIAIRGRDGLGTRGATFRGDSALFRGDALRQEVTLLGGTWELAAMPRGGWASALEGRETWWVLGLLFTLAGGFAAAQFSRQGQRVRESEAKYRTLMDRLSDGACIVQDGRLEFVNPRMAVITGVDRDQLLSRSWLDLVEPPDRERLSALASRILGQDGGGDRTLEAEVRIALPNGAGRYVRINLSRAEWNGQSALLATVSDVDDRKRLAEALRESHERLNGIIRALPDVAFIIDAQGRYLDVFGGRDSRFHHPGQALIGRTLQEVLPPEMAQRFLGVVHTAMETGRLQTVEYALTAEQIKGLPLDGPGGVQWFEGRVMPLGMDAMDAPMVIWLALNITARKQLEETLRLNARVFEDSNEGIFITDADNRIISVNGAFTRITGYEAAEVVGRNPKLLGSGQHDPAFYATMWDDIHRMGRWEGEVWNRRKDGRVYPQHLSVSVVRNGDGRISHHIAIFSDITRRKEAEAQIRHMALHDNLTGLANRVLFRDRLEQAIAQARRDRTLVALLFIDLDDFKPVNDRLGHGAGDRALQEVANRLRVVVRRVDTVARMGGDEFVILLQGLEEEAMAYRVAEKVIHSLEEPVTLDGQHCVVGASVGISLYPNHGQDHDSLMHAADQALYQAKAQGKNRYRLWSG
jgi:diguanylate cyclase (GGDEF)-like protein/PAS domain S-box-containing protein